MSNAVKPSHYTHAGIECIDAIEAASSGWDPATAYHLGNVLKYTWRYAYKGGVEDLQKATWYLVRTLRRHQVNVGDVKRIVEDVYGVTL